MFWLKRDLCNQFKHFMNSDDTTGLHVPLTEDVLIANAHTTKVHFDLRLQ